MFFSCRSSYCVFSLPLLAIVSAITVPSYAQQNNGNTAVSSPQSQSQNRKRTAYDLLRYDPQASGPMLVVSPSASAFDIPEKIDPKNTFIASFNGKTPNQFAEGHLWRFLNEGSLSGFIPRNMSVIVTNPPPADPFAGMRSDERLPLLLSLLTPEQWKLAGSETGIGAGDLTDAQRPLFLGLLPEEKLSVQTMTVVPGEKPEDTEYIPKGEPEEFDVEKVRLRLVRRTNFHFRTVGSEEYSATSRAGGPIDNFQIKNADGTVSELGNDFSAPIDPDPESKRLYGATVIQSVPNRLKAGQLSLDTPALQVPITISGNTETVGNFLRRLSKATHLQLIADRRIAQLFVLSRTTPGGQTVVASDALKLLCRMFTSTFRRLDQPNGEPLFLLTDHVEGIGTRFARLNEWADAADDIKRDATEKAQQHTANGDPLPYLGFAPDDPFALPPDVLKKVDAAYHAERYAEDPEFTDSELTPALREQLKKEAETWRKLNSGIQTDRVRVGTLLACQFVLPDKRAFEPYFSTTLPSNYLQSITIPPQKPTTSTTASPAKQLALSRFPAVLRKRVLLCPLPPKDADTRPLLIQAKQKGFTDIWLRVSRTSAPTAAKRFPKIIAQGKRLGLRIGAATSLLKRDPGETFGKEDQAISGETGTRAIEGIMQRNKQRHPNYPQAWYDTIVGFYSGWVLPDFDAALPALSALAQVPDLSALVLQSTVAPGWAEDGEHGSNTMLGGALGYSIETRLTYLRSEGIDPIDIPNDSGLGFPPDLPIFPVQRARYQINTFRMHANNKEMVRLYAALRSIAPELPLYLDDRISPFSPTESSWYGRWDRSDRLPVPPPAGTSNDFAGAKAFTSDPLLSYRAGSKLEELIPPRFRYDMNKAIASAVKHHWPGITLDCSALPTSEVLHLLTRMPDEK